MSGYFGLPDLDELAMVFDRHAYILGHDAYLNGIPYDNNQYNHEAARSYNLNAAAWSAGWEDARGATMRL